MARYIGPVCRLCRREGMKLFLKGERCYTDKCAIEKRNVPPGQHGRARKAKMAIPVVSDPVPDVVGQAMCGFTGPGTFCPPPIGAFT